eukprot:5906999-Pyramimonas_sp.AAC.1
MCIRDRNRAVWSPRPSPPPPSSPPPLLFPVFPLLFSRAVGLRSAQLSPLPWAPGRPSGGGSHADHLETS